MRPSLDRAKTQAIVAGNVQCLFTARFASQRIFARIAEFESRVALADNASTSDQQAALYRQAITFYSGDLLTDCYEEW